MNVQEIYARYKIMPFLAAHQMRVAAVAELIAKSVSLPLRIPEIISACLLHDMGNILKFDLSYFPEALEPQGRDYWEKVKEEFKTTYGEDEHHATLAIAKEIGVSDLVLSYINAVGFRNAQKNTAHDDIEKKICCYADMRVAPSGVTSLDGRFADGQKRYEHRVMPNRSTPSDREANQNALRLIERQIFSLSSIKAEDITDDAIKNIVPTLSSFKIVIHSS